MTWAESCWVFTPSKYRFLFDNLQSSWFLPHLFFCLPLETPQLRLTLPHELLHDLLHPHLQSQEADAVVPPEAEEVQQVPVSLLQHEILPAEDGAPAHHLSPVFQS